MRASTAAGLVGAAMLSTLVFPFVGLALRRHEEADRELHLDEDPDDEGSPPFGGEPAVRPQPAALGRRVTGSLLTYQLHRLVDGGLGLAGLGPSP